MKKGFTVIELIVSIAIIAILAGIVLVSMNKYRQKEILKANTSTVVAVLREAQAKTLVAEGDSTYGVHFDDNQAVIFVGDTYNDSSGSNEIFYLSNLVGLATTSLGATDVVFSRLTGESSIAGAVNIYWLADPSASTTVNIHQTGIISLP